MTYIRTGVLLYPELLTQFYLIQETTDAEFRHVIQRPKQGLLYRPSSMGLHAGSLKPFKK
jgi:hypothetical protein